jgi:hypothetical protein
MLLTHSRPRRVSTRCEFVWGTRSAHVQALVLVLCSLTLTSAGAFLGQHDGGRTSRVLQVNVNRCRPATPLCSLFRGKYSQRGSSGSGESGGRNQIDGDASQTQTPSPIIATKLEWEVFVDQSKSSLDKGGSATLDAFVGLSPASVKVQPVIISKTKSKGPLVRCISTRADRNSFDVSNVDSVDKVYRILTRHLRVDVSKSMN